MGSPIPPIQYVIGSLSVDTYQYFMFWQIYHSLSSRPLASPTIPQTVPSQNPRGSTRTTQPNRGTTSSNLERHATWSLPSLIWSQPWQPSRIENPIEGLESIEDIARFVMTNSNIGSPRQKLSIRGKNVLELAANLRQELVMAGASNDYSKILSPDREFIV